MINVSSIRFYFSFSLTKHVHNVQFSLVHLKKKQLFASSLIGILDNSKKNSTIIIFFEIIF